MSPEKYDIPLRQRCRSGEAWALLASCCVRYRRCRNDKDAYHCANNCDTMIYEPQVHLKMPGDIRCIIAPSAFGSASIGGTTVRRSNHRQEVATTAILMRLETLVSQFIYVLKIARNRKYPPIACAGLTGNQAPWLSSPKRNFPLQHACPC